MTNEEKANALAKDYLLGHDRANITYEEMLGACLDMAEWKDRQFKEYLEKKKDDIMQNPYSGHCLSDMHLIEEIINELFGEE